jgi:RNA recognition motif-containing protein
MNETYLDENFRDVDFNLTKTTYEETEEEHEDKHVTKLFVGNLPTSTTLPELLAVFKRFGPVNEKLSVVKDQNYAFIHFYNRDDAKVALQEINDSLFKDRYMFLFSIKLDLYLFIKKEKRYIVKFLE